MALIPFRNNELWLDPFREMESIQREMNRLFDFSLTRGGDRERGLLEGLWNPAIDIYDSKDTLLIKAELPGVNKEDIELSVHNNVLTIKGEKKQEKETNEKGFVRSERFYGSFNRTISLPADVDAGKVQAEFKNGVLNVTLPKKEEAKKQQIKIDVT